MAQVVSGATLFWSLFDAGLNGDFGVAAELIADDCEYVMMPTMELSEGRPAVLKAMGRAAGAFDRARQLTITFDAASSDWGVFEFVNEGTVAPGIVDLAASSDWQFSAEPSTLIGHSYKAPVCIVYHINANRKIWRIHEYTDIATLMKSIT